MKKITLCAVFAALCLLLSGCANPTLKDVDLEKAYETAMDTIKKQVGDAPVMERETDKEVLEMMYPGIGEINAKQLVVYVSPMSGMPAEVVMIETRNANDAKKAEDIFKTRVETQSADSFYPATVAQWKNAAKVTVNGNIVVMAVMPEGVALPREFLAKF